MGLSLPAVEDEGIGFFVPLDPVRHRFEGACPVQVGNEGFDFAPAVQTALGNEAGAQEHRFLLVGDALDVDAADMDLLLSEVDGTRVRDLPGLGCPDFPGNLVELLLVRGG